MEELRILWNKPEVVTLGSHFPGSVLREPEARVPNITWKYGRNGGHREAMLSLVTAARELIQNRAGNGEMSNCYSSGFILILLALLGVTPPMMLSETLESLKDWRTRPSLQQTNAVVLSEQSSSLRRRENISLTLGVKALWLQAIILAYWKGQQQPLQIIYLSRKKERETTNYALGCLSGVRNGGETNFEN